MSATLAPLGNSRWDPFFAKKKPEIARNQYLENGLSHELVLYPILTGIYDFLLVFLIMYMSKPNRNA